MFRHYRLPILDVCQQRVADVLGQPQPNASPALAAHPHRAGYPTKADSGVVPRGEYRLVRARSSAGQSATLRRRRPHAAANMANDAEPLSRQSRKCSDLRCIDLSDGSTLRAGTVGAALAARTAIWALH